MNNPSILKFGCIAALLLVTHFQGFAQFPAGAGRMGAAGQNLSIGHFYGKVVDAKTGKGLEAVSVSLIQNKIGRAHV